MSRRHRRHHKPRFSRQTSPGAPPGTVSVDPSAPLPVIHVFAYSPDQLHEETVSDLSAVERLMEAWPCLWINVDGLGDAGTISRLGEIFKLHRLALEDVVNVHQRAKVEHYADHLFITARMVSLNEKLETEQVSFFLGRAFVLTFQQSVPGDCFDPIRLRLRDKSHKIRALGPDYLLYALLDAVIDSYFPVLEEYGERLDALETEILSGNNEDEVCLGKVHDVKRELRSLRRSIWPHREAVQALIRESRALIKEETGVYLRDCYDHTIQIIDLLETDRELASDLTDLYLSHIAQRTNEVMKVLTVIATIFIPLTFIVGVYGMNFDTSHVWNMPELRWRYGYPACLAGMAAIAAWLLWFFYRKKWFGGRKDPSSSPTSHQA